MAILLDVGLVTHTPLCPRADGTVATWDGGFMKPFHMLLEAMFGREKTLRPLPHACKVRDLHHTQKDLTFRYFQNLSDGPLPEQCPASQGAVSRRSRSQVSPP